MSSKKFLITGGCGFIGTNLIKNLVSKPGHFIRILDNLSVGTREDLAHVCDFQELDSRDLNSSLLTPDPSSISRVELIVGDILDADLAIKATQDMDVIVHLAASTGVDTSVKNPRQDMEANVIGTLNYLEAARQNRVSKFIFASSSAPIGECEPPIHEEMTPHPVSPYGASKLAGEAYCSAYYRTYGIETIALRFGNVYGPGSSHKNSVVAKFIKQAKNGEICEIYGDGNQSRDFIFIDDLVNAISKAANPTAFSPNMGGEIFQIATSKEHTVNEVAQIIKTELKENYDITMQIKYGEPRAGDVKRNYSDTSKALEKLGWRAKVELSEGLKKTIEWFLDKASW